ncbi:MAG TPA: hypothetical protein VMT66_05840 [Steroidobacteraceae bacterium]|nr:hypothetical protein [Steroidobacteraceae bacterium]
MELIFVSAVGMALILAAGFSELVQARCLTWRQVRPGRAAQTTRWFASPGDCDTVTVQVIVAS